MVLPIPENRKSFTTNTRRLTQEYQNTRLQQILQTPLFQEKTIEVKDIMETLINSPRHKIELQAFPLVSNKDPCFLHTQDGSPSLKAQSQNFAKLLDQKHYAQPGLKKIMRGD